MSRKSRDHRSAPVPSVRQVAVSDEEDGRRLDNFLLARLKGVPRAHVYRLIRSGQVRVNGGRAGPQQRLESGNLVRIPPVRTASETGFRAAANGDVGWLESRVLIEDEDLIVLDKPAGLAVHGGSGVALGAIELLRLLRPDCRSLGLVHRLDRETSGCLLVAKRESGLRRLQAQFREGSTEKQYLALMHGRLPRGGSLVDAALLTTERRGGERHVRVDPAGKPSLTRFEPVERFEHSTLARVTLLTGRTHQIRVHAAHIGMPLVGDERYGQLPDAVAEAGELRKRLFLHATSLSFQHPREPRRIEAASEIPADLAACLSRLRRA